MITSRCTIWFLLAITVACWCAGCQAGRRTPGKYPQVAEALTSAIEHELADKGIPAIAIAVADSDGTIWSRGFGNNGVERNAPVNPATLFRIGGIANIFTAVAVMQLAERGVLDLDAPVQRYLPDLPDGPSPEPVTLRLLLAHRAGLVREPPVGSGYDGSGASFEDMAASLSTSSLVYPPGERIKYSTAGYAVAGLILQHAAGLPFADYLRNTVLAPAGMARSSFRRTPDLETHLAQGWIWSDTRALLPAAFSESSAPTENLYSSAEDLAHFLQVLLAEGKTAQAALLRPKTLALMMQPQSAGAANTAGFGLGFALSELDGHPAVGHGGAGQGFTAQVLALPDQGLGVAVLASLDNSDAVVDGLARYALRLMLYETGRSSDPPRWVKTQPASSEFLPQITGRYKGPQQAIRIVEQDGEMYLVDENSKVRLRAYGDQLITDDRHRAGRLVEIVEDSPDTLRMEGQIYRKAMQPDRFKSRKKWSAITGEYGCGRSGISIQEHEGRLVIVFDDLYRFALRSTASDTYSLPEESPHHGETLRFLRNTRGQVDGLSLGGIKLTRRGSCPVEPDSPPERVAGAFGIVNSSWDSSCSACAHTPGLSLIPANFSPAPFPRRER